MQKAVNRPPAAMVGVGENKPEHVLVVSLVVETFRNFDPETHLLTGLRGYIATERVTVYPRIWRCFRVRH